VYQARKIIKSTVNTSQGGF